MTADYGEYRITGEGYHQREPWILYRAVAPDGATVTLKVLHAPRLEPGTPAGDEMINAFLVEAEAWRLLTTLGVPGMVELYDFGLAEDRVPWLAMEPMEGGDLRAWQMELCLDEKLDIMRRLFFALSGAHRMGFVHGCLTPEAILMTRDGEPKIADWGMGRVLERMNDPALPAIDLRYCAPEQVEMGRIDFTTDLYQFGAILYELLTGEPVFPEDDPDWNREAILHRRPHAPSGIDPEIPKYADWILLKCLTKSQDDRYWNYGAEEDGQETGATSSESGQEPISLPSSETTPAAPSPPPSPPSSISPAPPGATTTVPPATPATPSTSLAPPAATTASPATPAVPTPPATTLPPPIQPQPSPSPFPAFPPPDTPEHKNY